MEIISTCRNSAAQVVPHAAILVGSIAPITRPPRCVTLLLRTLFLLQRMRQGPLRDRIRLEAKTQELFNNKLKELDDEEGGPEDGGEATKQRRVVVGLPGS